MGVLRKRQDKSLTGLPLAEPCPPSQACVCSAADDTQDEERQDILPCKGVPFLGQRLVTPTCCSQTVGKRRTQNVSYWGWMNKDIRKMFLSQDALGLKIKFSVSF